MSPYNSELCAFIRTLDAHIEARVARTDLAEKNPTDLACALADLCHEVYLRGTTRSGEE